jgi:hypothetical protein
MSVLYRNNEQYYDPTAGAALKEWERSRKMEIKPGDIVRLTKQGMAKTQDVPFAVLAINGPIFTGVRLYDNAVAGGVPIVCGAMLYALPEKVEWFNSWKADADYARTMSETEYSELRKAVAVALGFDKPAPVVVRTEETPPETMDDIAPEDDEDGGTEVAEINAEAIKRAEELAQEVIKERTRADIFEGLYHGLLGKSLRAVV